MPEYETDRTENSKRKSQETLDSSQIQPHQQQQESSSSFSSKDQASEERNEYKETGARTIGTQHSRVEQNLDDQRREEENATDRASEQDKPLTGDQMNALTRDLAEHIEGMGNERSEEENAIDRASEEDKPLTGDQMNALTRDLADHVEGMGNEYECRVDETETTDYRTSASRENDLERTSDESDRNNRGTVNESICEQKKIDTISILISIRDINPDNDKIEANQRYDCKVQLTSDHPSAQHNGLNVVENSSVPTTTNENQMHPNEEMEIKRHDDKDLKADLPVEHQTSTKATTGDDQTTTSQINKNVVPDRKCEETECNRDTVAKPISEKTVTDTRCPDCHGRKEQSSPQKNEQLCEEHEETKSVKKPTASTTVETKQNAETTVPSQNDQQSKADSITDEKDKESEVTTTTSQIKKNVVPDRKCEETECNRGTVAEPISEKTVTETRCPHCHGRKEQSSHQKNEQLCEEHEETKSVEKPTAPTTVENKQNAETVPSQNDQQSKADSITDEKDKESEATTASITVKNKQNAETKVDSENDEQSKADSITDEHDKESEVHTDDDEEDSEKQKKKRKGSNDHEDTVLTEHVDRNRYKNKSALAKTDEAFTATAHKLAYEAKHLAVRVKDMFTKKRHHEIEVWPDGVVVGEEPENEPEPTEFIKAAHETIVKFNERLNSESSGSDLNAESEELDTHRPAQNNECAEEVCNTKAQEVRADEIEGSNQEKSDAEEPSETPVGAREMAKACGHAWKEKAMENSGKTDEKVCKCKETQRTAESNDKSAHGTTNENHEEKSSAAKSQSEDGEKVRQTAKNETETQSHVEEQADPEATANDENDHEKGQPAKLCNPTDVPESERAAWWDNLEKEATKRVNNLSNEAVAHGAKKIDKDEEKGQTEPTEDQENLKNSAEKSDKSHVANISDAPQTNVANDGQQSAAQKVDTSKKQNAEEKSGETEEKVCKCKETKRTVETNGKSAHDTVEKSGKISEKNMQTTAEDTSASDRPAPNTDKGRKQVESAARQQSTGAVPQNTNATRA